MEHVAAQRLIDASASLDPAGRALVGLWIHHGFDDELLSRVTGIEPSAIAARRESVIGELSGVLGLPPADVETAFAALGSEAAQDSRPRADAEPESPSSSVVPQPEPDSDPDPELTLEPPAPREPDREPASTAPVSSARPPGRRRGAGLAVVALLIAAVVVAVVLASGGSGSRHRRAPRPRSASVGARTLAPLPGMSDGASGEATIDRTGSKLNLELTVRHLPAIASGHYEVYLYDSIIDSIPIGALAAGSGTLSVALPPGAAHFRSIDVSRQLPGERSPSGEDVLRAPNPA